MRLYNGEATESKRFLPLGGPLGMQIRVSYSSKRDYHSQVGHNWAMEYVWRLYEVADTNAPFVVRKGNAKRTSYGPRGDGTYVSQDTEREILSIDTNGNYLVTRKDHSVYAFDTDGKLTSISDGMGAELRLTYNAGGKQPIVGRSLYSNLSTNMVVARDYQLDQVDEYIGTNATGRGYAFQYDSTGHITNIFDQASRNVSFTYSSAGELLEMRDPEGNAYTCTYDELGRLKTFVGLGCGDCVLVTDYYNAEGALTNQVQGVGAQGKEMIVEYPSPDRSIATFLVKGPDGAVLNTRRETLDFTIDGFGITRLKKKAIDNGFGVTNSIENWYDAFGQVTQRVENGVARTEYAYDGNYNKTWSRQEVSPGVWLVQTNTYDANDNLIERKSWQTDQPTNFFITRYECDAQNRKVKTKQVLDDATELVTEWVYDSNGQVERQIDPRGNATAYEYDSFGFQARGYDPSNTAYEMHFGYDSVGNQTNQIDALGRETRAWYDGLGRKVREVNALGYESFWIYSGPNLVEEETGRDGAVPGRVAQYGYDGLNKRITIDRLDDNGATQRWMSVAYDSDGNVLYETNALGYATAYTYDNVGHKKTELDPYGGLTTYDYDAWGNVTSVVDAAGVEIWKFYDYLGRLTNLVEAVGTDVERTTGYRYNGRGDRVEILQPDGSSTYFSYDALGRQICVGGSREYPAIYTYDENGNQITVTDARGYVTTNVYDAYDRLSEVIYPDGARNLFGYDLVGNRTFVTDGNTNTTYLVYDELNRQISVSIPNESNVILESRNYNPWNQVVETSNVAGGVIATFYDRIGNATNRVNKSGLSLSFEYDRYGHPLITRWPNGSYTSNTFNNMRLTAERNRSGHITHYSYDNMGRRITVIDSMGATNTASYNSLGLLASQSNALGGVTTFTYDEFDKALIITDANSKIKTYQYDTYGNITNQMDTGQSITYQYNTIGQRTNMIDANGNTTSWSYNQRGQLERQTYDDGSYYDYDYDGNGNLISRRDANNTITLYAYNAKNLLTLVDYPDSADVSFTYDNIGRRTSMVDGLGTNLWAYDVASRVVTNIQGLVAGELSYAYDAEGNRISMSVNGDPTSYDYDDAGRLTSVSNEVGVFTYTWHPQADLVLSVTYPSGASVTNAYDILRQLTDKVNLDSTGAVVSSFAYAYDPVGLRTNQTNDDGSGHAYGYDDTYQLINANGFLPGGGADTNYAHTYSYDSVGNYTQVVDRGVMESYQLNSMNQYTNTTTRPMLSYDLNGNLLDDSNSTYQWDQENRLILASNATGYVEFSYNGLGWKTEQREYTNGSLVKTTRYLCDGELPIAELDGNNAHICTISRGIDHSRALNGAGGIGGLLALTTYGDDGTNSYFYFSDGNGNIVNLIDESDAVVAHYEYDPFGKTSSASGVLAGQPYRFSSKEAIDIVNLYYYGFRYYSPNMGRWISRDPIQEYAFAINNAHYALIYQDMSLLNVPNNYLFTRNMPLSFIDPWGLCDTSHHEEALTTVVSFDIGVTLVSALSISYVHTYEREHDGLDCGNCRCGESGTVESSDNGALSGAHKIGPFPYIGRVSIFYGFAMGRSEKEKYNTCLGTRSHTKCSQLTLGGGAAKCVDIILAEVCLTISFEYKEQGCDGSFTSYWSLNLSFTYCVGYGRWQVCHDIPLAGIP